MATDAWIGNPSLESRVARCYPSLEAQSDCSNAPGWYATCTNWKSGKRPFTCPDKYVPRKAFGGSYGVSVDLLISCDPTEDPGEDGENFWSIKWTVETDIGTSFSANNAAAARELVECVLDPLENTHFIAGKKTAVQVDDRFSTWALADEKRLQRIKDTISVAEVDATMGRLFLIADRDTCVGMLSSGNFTTSSGGNWDRTAPYLCLDCVTAAHREWRQQVDDGSESFTVRWKFAERMTLKRRLNEAQSTAGVAVTWEVTRMKAGEEETEVIRGRWHYRPDLLPLYDPLVEDCTGNNLDVYSGSLDECRSHCDVNAKCQGFSYVERDGSCYTKHASCSNPVGPCEKEACFWRRRKTDACNSLYLYMQTDQTFPSKMYAVY